MSRQQVHVFYSGKVQGVGFRYTVKELVRGYEVAGLIRNLGDGRVELKAAGEKEELDAFLEGIRESGLGPLIGEETVRWQEPLETFRGFSIVG